MRLPILALLAFPVTAQAQNAVPAPDTSAQGDVAVTIYNNDLALVQDTRQLDLGSGRTRQEFPDVSANIRPETVTLSGSGIGIVEQNFDYDLLSPDKLMEKAVGRTVTLVRTDPVTKAETREEARVLANNAGTILQIGSRIEVYDRSLGRILFPSLPPNLRARPTLSVTLDSAKAERRPVTLSYLSRRLGWQADYVALFDEGVGKIDVQGWITLTNNSGTPFVNAQTLLVAGAVGDGSGMRTINPNTGRVVRGNVPGTQSANREQLGDFYVYPLKERTTIANAQQKQVSFMDVHGAQAAKAYAYRNDWLNAEEDAQGVDTVLRFSSAREGGLGDALPAGTVRVYMRDARGAPQFIGESAIPHTPAGSSLALKTGEAFDVKVQPKVASRKEITSGEWENSLRYRITSPGSAPTTVTVERQKTYWRTAMEYRVTNARSVPVVVEVSQGGLDHYWHDTRVSAESIKGEQLNADERLWRVTVPANGEVTLTASFDTRY
jgi:hypothetical protein